LTLRSVTTGTADRLTTVDTVYEEGSWLFTIRDKYGELDEGILVPYEDDRPDVEAWFNRSVRPLTHSPPHQWLRLCSGVARSPLACGPGSRPPDTLN
jgi:hypothetical protein